MSRVRWLGRAVILVAGASCASADLGAARARVATGAGTTFLHAGFTAGPEVFTDAGGRLVEERRHEPFGAPIEAGDVAARDLNALNKRTEPATGWSDHGARWLAPEVARWISPDPPVVGPGAGFMASPWALHPYQYVEQDPVSYWDPDGREPRSAADRSIRREIVDSLLDLQVPDGPALAAARRLSASTEEVDRNTAYRLAVGKNAVAYLDDAPHSKAEAWILAAQGVSSSEFEVLVNPVTQRSFVSLRRADGTTDGGVVFGRRNKSVEFWADIAVHEVNHDVNRDNDHGNPTIRFLGEFGAYWVSPGFRTLPPDQRAAAIKSHILTEYSYFAKYHREQPIFREFVKRLSAPARGRNLTNE